MPHSCTVCGTEIGPRDGVCRVCGTASGTTPGQTSSSELHDTRAAIASPAPGQTIPDNFLIMPQAALQNRNRQRFVRAMGGCVTAAVVLGVVGWTASALWRMGPGGEIAYKQHNTEGNQAFERGDFSDADAHYTAMIALRPRRADGYVLRAINDYKMGQFPQSVRDNTSALALSSSPMQRGTLYYNRAEGYLNHRKWHEATQDFTAAEQAYIQAGNQPGSYTRDDERQPGWLADVRRGRAHANFELKNYAQTIADYTANIKAGFVHPEEYGMRAAAEEGLGQDDMAIADYGRALGVDPGYRYAYQKMGLLVTRSHHYEQAAIAYRQATAAHPDNVFCWGSLGCYEHMAGHLPAAIAADKRGLSLDPDQAWIKYNLGLSYAVSGDTARTGRAYADALLIDSTHDGRAGALKEVGKELAHHPGSIALQSALKQMQQAVAVAPLTTAAPANGAAARPISLVDPKFESLLSKAEMRRGYDIRPPAGYTLKHTQGVYLSGSEDSDSWSGPARPDGTKPTVRVQIITDDGRMAAQATLRQRMQQYLADVNTNHSQFKASAITSLTMGSRAFLKATWSGIGVKTGRQYDSTVYIASQTGEYICIECHDSRPDSAASLPLLEASARTFH